MSKNLLEFDDKGIYCAAAKIYIDPWKPVSKAIITHGHSDHARYGHQHYLCHHLSAPILKHRLGDSITIQSIHWNEPIYVQGVKFSLHPAGHIVGSAQIRVEYKGEIWVVTGDYKLEDDGISGMYEPIPCHHFITECTFGLPIYQWQAQQVVFDSINDWWQENQSQKVTSILAGYSLGKAQRLLSGIDPSIGTIYAHGAIQQMNEVLWEAGISFPKTIHLDQNVSKTELSKALIIAPPGALGGPWMRRFKQASTAVASGWMAVRGNRRRRGVDRGFVLSDHIDWNGLNKAVELSNPEYVYATHGFTESVARWFRDQGRNATTVKTLYQGEQDDQSDSGE